jgi:aldehyde dehydrogenase (NAD+)
VKDEEEALDVANQTEFGLSSAVFALLVEAGMTHVNEHSVDDTPTGPFGGEKNTGSGGSILREFTRDHWVTVRHFRGSLSVLDSR